MFKRLRAQAEERRKQAWEIEREFVRVMKNSLDRLGTFPEDINGFQYAVDFFNVLAEFRQNVRRIWNAPKTASEAQKEMNRVLHDFDTSKYGKFIPKCKGEKASLDNTYWGEIFGISAIDAKFWVENEHIIYENFAEKWLRKPEQTDAEAEKNYQEFLNPPTYMVIIRYQVKTVIERAYKTVQNLCDVLLAAE